MNIWEDLSKPLLILAPMDDVTDVAFRRVVRECAAPDIMFTEFASADGLQSNGREAVLAKLRKDDDEGPLIAQIWGLRPESYEKTAAEIVEMGFDGIDINMGCPVPKVIKNGACSALINNRELAKELIEAAKRGANGKIPVSVKTRIGFNRIDESWTEFLLQQDIAALTVHGRTTKQMSKVPNNWEAIEAVRKQRDEIAPQTQIVGNGDILSYAQAMETAERLQLDGIMIGRGVFHDPFVFDENSPWGQISKQDKIDLFLRHIDLFEHAWKGRKYSGVLKKFAKVYINGFDGASALRAKLMETNSYEELKEVLQIEKS